MSEKKHPAQIATENTANALLLVCLMFLLAFVFDALAKEFGDWMPVTILFVVVAPWLWLYFYNKAKKP